MITEELILAAVQAVLDLIKGLSGAPSQAQVDAAIRTALVTASDLDMSQEYKGQAP